MVINIRNAPKGWKTDSKYVYIGRRNVTFGVLESKWHNPYRSGNREKDIEDFERYLYDSGLVNDVHELKGKILVCWCKPLACHGDILAELTST
jgi:hypothetical protein